MAGAVLAGVLKGLSGIGKSIEEQQTRELERRYKEAQMAALEARASAVDRGTSPVPPHISSAYGLPEGVTYDQLDEALKYGLVQTPRQAEAQLTREQEREASRAEAQRKESEREASERATAEAEFLSSIPSLGVSGIGAGLPGEVPAGPPSVDLAGPGLAEALGVPREYPTLQAGAFPAPAPSPAGAPVVAPGAPQAPSVRPEVQSMVERRFPKIDKTDLDFTNIRVVEQSQMSTAQLEVAKKKLEAVDQLRRNAFTTSDPMADYSKNRMLADQAQAAIATLSASGSLIPRHRDELERIAETALRNMNEARSLIVLNPADKMRADREAYASMIAVAKEARANGEELFANMTDTMIDNYVRKDLGLPTVESLIPTPEKPEKKDETAQEKIDREYEEDIQRIITYEKKTREEAQAQLKKESEAGGVKALRIPGSGTGTRAGKGAAPAIPPASATASEKAFMEMGLENGVATILSGNRPSAKVFDAITKNSSDPAVMQSIARGVFNHIKKTLSTFEKKNVIISDSAENKTSKAFISEYEAAKNEVRERLERVGISKPLIESAIYGASRQFPENWTEFLGIR